MLRKNCLYLIQFPFNFVPSPETGTEFHKKGYSDFEGGKREYISVDAWPIPK